MAIEHGRMRTNAERAQADASKNSSHPQAGAEVPIQSLPRVVIWLLVPLLYYAGAKLGVYVAAMPEGISILWPPNSVLLAAMLLGPRKDMPVIALLGIGTEVVADVPTFTMIEALIFGAANALEASVACLLLSLWRFDPRLGTLADLRKFLLAGPLVAAALAAAIGAAVYAHYRGGQTTYIEFFTVWWLGDAMGLLIFAPLLLSLGVGHTAGQAALATLPARRLDLVIVLIGAALAIALVLPPDAKPSGWRVAPVLLLPCLVYLAARFNLRVVSLAIAAIGLAIAYATAHGLEPFGPMKPREASMRAQEFILSMSLLCLGLSALLGQLRSRQEDLRAANERLDQLNRSLEARVAERTAQLDDSNRQLQHLAMTDPLTGLANRRAFYAITSGAVDNALRHQRPLAAMMIDIDHFKQVNDQHGHAVGDSVLKHVAATLNSMLRSADVLARYGGEEFVLLAPETDLDSALTLARRMQAQLRAQPAPTDVGPIAVTACFGVTVLGGRGDDLGRLLLRADAALYACKAAGRDQVIALPPPESAPGTSAPA